MATQLRVLVAVLVITLVAAEQGSYMPRVRRRPMLSPQEGPDSGLESEQDGIIHEGPPSDFNPSPRIPDESLSENEQTGGIGGLTVQDPPKGWPFSDIALQEKFQEQQMNTEETAQRQMWASPPEQSSKQHRYRQGRLLDGTGSSKGRKEQGSREQEGSGEQTTYRDYAKKKRIVKPSHSQGMRIRHNQPPKQYHTETTQSEEQPQQYHQDQFEQQKHIQQEQFEQQKQIQQEQFEQQKQIQQGQFEQQKQIQQEQFEQQKQIQQEQFGNPEPILQEDLSPRPPKKSSKRRPTSSANAGGSSSVNVGYSLNFGNQEGGAKSPRNPVGIVQSEVIHGEGAVSYSNAQIGNSHPDQIRSRPANANSIEGRPIYVPPITSSGYNRIPQQNPPFNFPNQSPEHESLPSPAALVGEQEINNYVPEGVSVVKSTNHFEIQQGPEAPQIITHFDSQGPQGQFEVKPTKPPTILHINDGTDFKWKNLGNGVEISAPVTPNGHKGGYRESIPIQEDNEEDIPVFDKKPPVFTPIPPKPIVFNTGATFEDSNILFSGPTGDSIDGLNFPKQEFLPTPQELTSNHIFEDSSPKIPSPIQNGPPPFSRRPNVYNHNFAEPPPQKNNDDLLDNLGFPKFPEMNKIYYLPANKHGESPIPAVVMPLSVLRQITGALDSQSTANLGQDISTADFMRMLGHNDAGPEPAAPFQEQPRPTKQRNHSFNPNKGHQNHENHGSNRPSRGHHRYQQSYNSNKFNVGPYGVKITKSIPIYEQHTVSNPNENAERAPSHGPWNAPSKVQHYNIPLDAYDSLRPNTGNFKSRPNANHFREEGFPSGSGRQHYRHARQNHQQTREASGPNPGPGDHPNVADGESFAVTSSYRIGPSAPSGWNKHGRN